jgi:hypothetical protein
MYKKLILLSILGVAFLKSFSQGSDVKLDTIDNYNDWGWQSLVIENGFIQLVIVPEIGGRVLYYGFPDDEYMWINSDQLGKTYDPDVNVNGPWGTSSGYGGYKVWPAPQSKWNWPPPPHLAWGPYTFKTEAATPDSVVVYVRSQVETTLTPGLQLARRYKVYRNTSRVIVEQILINVKTAAQSWGIWDVTQATVKHEGSSDYANFSTYFPAGISTINGKTNGAYSAVNEDVTKYKFSSGKSGKMYSFLSEGWMSFVDERDEQSYTKIFEIFPDNDNHPDNNSNFEIYSSGGEYIELEVLSPIEEIQANGDSIAYTEYWYAARVNGDILGANHAGIIRNRLHYNATEHTVSGEFGAFSSGYLQLTCYNADNQVEGTVDPVNVNAADKVTLLAAVPSPEATKKIRILAYDTHDNLIGTLDSVSTDDDTYIPSSGRDWNCLIYPTRVAKGTPINLEISNPGAQETTIEIISPGDGKVSASYVLKTGVCNYSMETSRLMAGLYLVTVKNANRILREKIIIY